jgi:putative peptidoglycan lipid II flippase
MDPEIPQPAPPHGKPPQRPTSVGRGALVAGAAHMLSRASGLIRDIVFTAIFGAGAMADAYFAAFRVPHLFRELLAEGTLSNVFIPLFAEVDEGEGRQAAWALANAILGCLLVLLGLVTIGIFLLAEPFVLLVASGYADDPDKLALTAWLTRLFSPFLVGISIAALFGGMLNVRGKFFLPTLAPALLNVFIIGGCLLGDQWSTLTGTPAIGAVALAATLSGLFTAAVQYPALRKTGFRFRPVLRRHPALGRVAKFVGAAMVSIVVVQFNLLVETQMASTMGDGPVTYLMMGFRLVQLPMSVVSGSVAVASLAALSVSVARSDMKEAQGILSRAMEMNDLLVLPAAVGLFLLADPLVALCFERGAFTAVDTAMTAGVLRMYAVAVVGICAYRVLLPAFFALGDPYTPMRLSLVVMAMKVPVAWLLVHTLGLGLDGLPLSHAVTVSLEVAAMVWILHRRLDGWSSGFWGQHSRILIAAGVMGGAVMGLRVVVPDLGGFGVILICGGGAAVYGAAVVLLRVRALAPLIHKFKNKLNRKRR